MPFGIGRKSKDKQINVPAARVEPWTERSVWALIDRKQLHDDAIRAVNGAIADREQVVAIVPGAFDQAIIATNRRVYIFKKGSIAGSFRGQKLATWEYRAIHGVQVEMGRTAGYVALQISGTSASDMSYWSQDKDGPAKSAHAIPIVDDKKNRTTDGVKALRRALDQFGR